jgi:hypothetical protein
VPQDYLTPISPGIFELDVEQFRLDLLDLEDSEDGIVFPNTHRHNTTVELSGVVYARSVEIINNYKVDFQPGVDPNEHYIIRCVGANHNIADVLASNHRHFSLVVSNAAGLIVSTGPTLVDANILSIDGSTQSALLMRIASETMIVGTVAAVISDSEIDITFSDFDTEETTSLEGRRIIFTSGNKAKEAARITSYAGQGVGVPARLGVTQLSSVPSIGATVVVV